MDGTIVFYYCDGHDDACYLTEKEVNAFGNRRVINSLNARSPCHFYKHAHNCFWTRVGNRTYNNGKLVAENLPKRSFYCIRGMSSIRSALFDNAEHAREAFYRHEV